MTVCKTRKTISNIHLFIITDYSGLNNKENGHPLLRSVTIFIFDFVITSLIVLKYPVAISFVHSWATEHSATRMANTSALSTSLSSQHIANTCNDELKAFNGRPSDFHTAVVIEERRSFKERLVYTCLGLLESCG